LSRDRWREIMELTLAASGRVLLIMTLELKPEQERVIREEIQSGRFRSPDEMLAYAFAALREKNPPPQSESQKPKKNLVELFAESPFQGMEMNFDRFPDILPPVNL
jgi:Arc/MetJ-type ribon-helix-helix transcriptional regulator